jgi:cellulose synthase/poly-beta-1,6-N-acetylglucosamine synthase-like glycosyltransferase
MLLLPRVGKAIALNTAIEHARGEILVFSDANSIYATDAIARLTAPFADPSVGGVAGNQRYLNSRSNNLSQSGEKNYWNFDRLMKIYESRSGNVISATGAIYAIRRSLFQPIIDGVTDDFYTSTAVIEQGFRLVFEPEAISYEPVSADASHEFRRKVRIMTRGLSAVIARRRLLNPMRYGFYALQLFSHKVLRRLVVFPLLVALITSLVLAASHPFYALAAAAQVAFYGMALVGFFLRGRRSRLLKIATIPFYFSLVNAAALMAALNILRGNRIALWEPRRAAQPALDAEPGLTAAQEKQGTR